ncbi:restriction endonuclease [Pseudofrankia asymbiotica]|uniref:Restriction endonuclease n=1 Tax=Pseudofrankia asymbiotica TaxID=1834516 RepID=A0A1V2HZE2_9ACTN|nr:restriction endonuclease [Pseudofrankia asymbiotica]
MELAKGANTAVPSPVVRVSLASSLPAHAVDLFTLELTGERRVRDDGDLVFYNQRRSADGCLWQVDDQRVRIELGDLADDVETVVVAAGLDDGWTGTFTDDAGLRVRVEVAGESAWDGPGTGAGAAWAASHRVVAGGGERCMVLVELYRRGGGWKVRAVSQGWEAGTAALLTEHGVRVEQAPTPVRPAPPELRTRPAAPLPPTLPLPPAPPEVPRRPVARPAEPIAPTRPYAPSPWGAGGGVDPSDAPTEIVASPTGAWPAWPRQPAATPGAGSADRPSPVARRSSGWDGARARGGDDSDDTNGAGEAGGDGSGGWRGWAGASRLLHVRPVARVARRAPLDLLAMDPYDFEQLVANLFTGMGYTTQRTGRSGDGGVDVEVRSDDPLASGLIVISVKRLKRTVAAHYVRELAGTVHDRDAIKGILVTTSGFGPSSWEFAAKNRLELVDGERLRAWLAEYLDLDAI